MQVQIAHCWSSLGILLDPELLLNVACQPGHFVEKEDPAMVTHSQVASRLDCCNMPYVGIGDVTETSVSKECYGSPAGIGQSDKHVAPILHKLHWLSIQCVGHYLQNRMQTGAEGPKEASRPLQFCSATEIIKRGHSSSAANSWSLIDVHQERRSFSVMVPQWWVFSLQGGPPGYIFASLSRVYEDGTLSVDFQSLPGMVALTRHSYSGSALVFGQLFDTLFCDVGLCFKGLYGFGSIKSNQSITD